MDSYVEVFDFINLLPLHPGLRTKGDKFPVREAKLRAKTLSKKFKGRRVVFVGKAVSRAFGAKQDLFQFDKTAELPFEHATIPHPSGVNLWWNSTENVDLARQFMQSLVEEIS